MLGPAVIVGLLFFAFIVPDSVRLAICQGIGAIADVCKCQGVAFRAGSFNRSQLPGFVPCMLVNEH